MKKIQKSVRLNENLLKVLMQRASKNHRTLSGEIEHLLTEKLSPYLNYQEVSPGSRPQREPRIPPSGEFQLRQQEEPEQEG